MLKRVFYRFYELMIFVGNKSVAEYFALLMLTFLCSINIITAICALYILTDLKIDTNPILLFIFFFGTLLFFYFLFLNKNKFETIVAEYKSENQHQKIIGRVYTMTYIILSLLALYISFYCMIIKNTNKL